MPCPQTPMVSRFPSLMRHTLKVSTREGDPIASPADDDDGGNAIMGPAAASLFGVDGNMAEIQALRNIETR